MIEEKSSQRIYVTKGSILDFLDRHGRVKTAALIKFHGGPLIGALVRTALWKLEQTGRVGRKNHLQGRKVHFSEWWITDKGKEELSEWRRLNGLKD